MYIRIEAVRRDCCSIREQTIEKGMDITMEAVDIVRELRKGAIAWYSFKAGSRLLIVMNNEDYANQDYCDMMSEYFSGLSVAAAITNVADVMSGIYAESEYDYILGLMIIETSKQPADLLKLLTKSLAKDGKLLLGTDNRLGVRYFCGDRDIYTGRSFDGIENYCKMNTADRANMTGRCYSKEEIKNMLEKAGLGIHKFYSVMPNLYETQLVYAENFLPQEELAIRYFPRYNYPDSVFLEEENLYTDLIKNGLFHTMANAYIIECSVGGASFDDTLHATLSLDRGSENALVTAVKENSVEKWVEKRPIYLQGRLKARKLMESAEYLREHGIRVVAADIENDIYSMPYIDSPIAMNYMYDLAGRDKNAYIAEMDRFVEIILSSSEHIKEDAGDGMGVTLARGYLDIVPLNCFYVEDETLAPKDRYLFYDQEFYQENYPANAIIYRAVTIVCMPRKAELDGIVPMEFFFDRYGLDKEKERWARMSAQFTDSLRHQSELRSHNDRYKCNLRTLFSNRQRMNYSAGEYQKIFVDILKNTDNKKVILFGSGKFTQRFLVQFKGCCEVYAIVDNNADRWGTTLEGIEIKSPDILKSIEPKERHIIICIKNFVGIVLQLRGMGIEDYHIYDPGVIYPRNRKTGGGAEGSAILKKSYHTGYIAGVFDLFHIGHLNMFRRAKEQCDYLIVGVVSDEGVRINKGTEPFVPFEERIEMVRSCRYVDEAVEIPFNYGTTKDAYEMYHFDCQFSGSDYVNNPNWLAEKEFLEKNGAEMVFFPYTESTSSTKLKKMIDKKLL